MEQNMIGAGDNLFAEHVDVGVLIVDDDEYWLEELGETISNLGYSVISANNAIEALQIMAKHPKIGIVVTDIDMPVMDGISLLSEIASRFSAYRPVVTLVITGCSDLATAASAMRVQAVDMLSKPVAIADIAAALRRASVHQHQAATRHQITALAERFDPPVVRKQHADPANSPTSSELRAFVQVLLKAHCSKPKFFEPWVVAGPSWEILLDLAAAKFSGENVPISSASAITLLSPSTALRHINNLVAAGLVRRWVDPVDKRRSLLELQPQALEAMQRYLESAWKLQAQTP